MSTNFKEYAKYYDFFNSEKDYTKESSYINWIIKKYSPKTKSILDIGCGTGLHDFELANLNYDVTGLDISQDMIEIARAASGTKNATIEIPATAAITADSQGRIILSQIS